MPSNVMVTLPFPTNNPEQVLTTGRLGPDLEASQALALERPSTAQRDQGRCPLTVLQPRPGGPLQLGAAGGATAESAASRVQNASGEGGWDEGSALVSAPGPPASGAARRTVTMADEPAALAGPQDGPISLKVRQLACTGLVMCSDLQIVGRGCRAAGQGAPQAQPITAPPATDRAVAAAAPHPGGV